jgi:tetratricopeptide (TPR) repeat protein
MDRFKQGKGFRGLAVLLLVALTVAPIALGTASLAADSDTANAKRIAREQARQARINDYLKKKEERQLERNKTDAQQAAERTAKAIETEQQALNGTTAGTATVATTAPTQKSSKPNKRNKRQANAGVASELPRGLATAQENVRRSRLGQNQTVQTYLEMVENREASPQHLGAFGNFLAESGMRPEALEYYAVALALDQEDPVLWMNVGTIHRQLGELKEAAAAYATVLSIDVTNASAHYNLGATLDELGKYEDAIHEYTEALKLDPSLGDPTINPQAANNERMLEVKLMLYRSQTGNKGLPLLEVPIDGDN